MERHVDSRRDAGRGDHVALVDEAVVREDAYVAAELPELLEEAAA